MPGVNVVFVEPFFPSTQRNFVRGLAEAGATVIGIGESPPEMLDDQLKSWMTHYHQVPTVIDVGILTDTVRWVQDKLWVDRLESTIEAHTLAAAQARENCTIPGTSVRTAWLCRDKPSMKEALRAAGVPTAASTAAGTAAEVLAFADAVGYPAHPQAALGSRRDGHHPGRQPRRPRRSRWVRSAGRASSRSRWRSSSKATRASTTPCPSTGMAALDFVSHYFPNVLDAMRTPWISPQFISTNRVDTAEDYRQLRELGQRVNEALGIGTSATHMEWFFGPKGLRFSEIGCRPPGVGAWDLYSVGNDIDVYREWANAIVHGGVSAQPSRRFATGIIALRPDRDGQITGYSGVEDIQARSGEWVIDAHLPPPGTPTQPAAAGYMANAYIRMKHPDYDVLRGMLDDVGRTVHVYAA